MAQLEGRRLIWKNRTPNGSQDIADFPSPDRTGETERTAEVALHQQTPQTMIVGSEDFGETLNRHGETLNRHGETGNGPDAEDDHFPTTQKKRSLSYADAARGTKRYVTFE